MYSFDVSVLIYAHRMESEQHDQFRHLLETTVGGTQRYGVSELVLSGFLRIVTRAGLWEQPTPLSRALDFVEAVRDAPAAVVLRPGPRHWALFVGLLRATSTTGATVADAYHAALALEHGAQWVTTDRDFARFRDLALVDPRDLFDRGA